MSPIFDAAGGVARSGDGGSRRRRSVAGDGGDGEGDVADPRSSVLHSRDSVISLDKLSSALKQLSSVKKVRLVPL